MFKAEFHFKCDICGKEETKTRSFGDKLRVNKGGQGTFSLRPFFNWEIMELCFDRRYEMIGPHKEDMLTFTYAVCSDGCHRKLDAKLADIHEPFWEKIQQALREVGLEA